MSKSTKTETTIPLTEDKTNKSKIYKSSTNIVNYKTNDEYSAYTEDSNVWDMITDYLRELSKVKDIALIINSISSIINYVGKLYIIYDREDAMKKELHSFLTQAQLFSKNDFQKEQFQEKLQKIKPKINKIINKFFKLDENSYKEFNNGYEKISEWIKSKKYNEKMLPKKIIQTIVDQIIKSLSKFIHVQCSGISCFKEWAKNTPTKIQNNWLHQYNVSEKYDSKAKLILSKLSSSDPDELKNLYFYLNRVKQQFHFLNIDLLLNDLNEHPVLSRVNEWKWNDQKLSTLKQDIYKNKSRLFSNYALNPRDFYHDKLITIKKLDPKDGPHFIESMLQNMTHGSDETLKKYISGEIKFSNEPFK